MNEIINLIQSDEYYSWLQPVLNYLREHPWLQAATVFFITFVVASIITWTLFKVLRKLTQQTKTYTDDKILSIAHSPIYYSLVITGFSTAIKIAPLSDKLTDIFIHGFKSIGVMIWVVALIRFSKIILKQLAWLSKKGRFIRPQTLPLFDNLMRIVIVAVGIYAAFLIWGIDMTAWLASAGIIGIAVGFAAKDTLANLFSGVFILADTPYKIGDYVVLDQGSRAKVTHIGIRSTRFLTRDDVEVTVPNSIIGNSKIINQSGGPYTKFRLRVKIGVAYGSDIDQVRAILMDIAQHESLVCKSPAPRVRFRAFGASSLDFELLCWVDDPELRGRALDKLNTDIYKSFMAKSIEIPYSKTDLYIKEMPQGRSEATDLLR